jgi:dihydrofolate synthase/folylpolyglutamate synthase
MMTLHPKVIDLTLDRVHRLLAALGHPERALPPVIHIAGTNGKGSTQAMIRAGLEAGATGPCLYLAPSGAVPRTHPAGGRTDLRTRADRASG